MNIILKTFLISFILIGINYPVFADGKTKIEVNVYIQPIERNLNTKEIKMMKGIAERQWSIQNEKAMKVDYIKDVIDSLKQSKYDKAIEQCKIGLSYQDYIKNVKIYYHYLGLAYLKKQNYIKAIENYNIAINNYKDNSPEIFYERGLARLQIDDYEGAKEDYIKAISLGLNIGTKMVTGENVYNYTINNTPERSKNTNILTYFILPTMNNYGKTITESYLIKKGKYESTLDFYSKKIKGNQNDVTAYNNRGVYYLLNNDYENALSDFQSATKLNPNIKEPYFNLALLYYTLEKYESAKSNLNKFIEIQIQEKQSSNQTSKNNEYILEILTANIELKLQNIDIANNFYNKYKTNDFANSYEWLNKLDMDYLPLLEGKAYQYIVTKKYKKALNTLRDVLTLEYKCMDNISTTRGKYFYFFSNQDFNIDEKYEVKENNYIYSNMALIYYKLGKSNMAKHYINLAKNNAFKMNDIVTYKKIIKTYNLIK